MYKIESSLVALAWIGGKLFGTNCWNRRFECLEPTKLFSHCLIFLDFTNLLTSVT
jgi:hypothetical protein